MAPRHARLFCVDGIPDVALLIRATQLRHYDITGWYGMRTDEYGGLSPREYLSDKSWEERRRIGLDALVTFKVLKP